MVRIIPDSGPARRAPDLRMPLRPGQALREFNQCHNPAGDGGGRFCSDPESGGGKGSEGKGAKNAKAETPEGRPPGSMPTYPEDQLELPLSGAALPRPKPVKVESLEEAMDLLLKGVHVEMNDVGQVHTLIDKLAEMALDARDRGEDAPDYDLCNVSVSGSNIFCAEGLKTPEHPAGVPRIEMPQFSGTPVPGSQADQLPKSKNGSVNAATAFIEHLRERGIAVTEGSMPVAELKATQGELVGEKVASMMTSTEWDPGEEPIFVSRDQYVIDGHHRWAAVVGRDAEDGQLGEKPINIFHVDAPITEVLSIANTWSKDFGIAAKAGEAKANKRPGAHGYGEPHRRRM